MRPDDEGVVQLIKLAESYGDVSGVVTQKLPAPADREDWLRLRKRGIGGSDAAAVLGLDPYRTVHDVYADKLSDSIEQDDNPHMKRGRKLERLIISEYAETHPEDTIMPGQPTYHDLHQWMIGTPDGYIISPQHQNKGVIEVKCPAKYAFEKIKLEGIPPHYVVQMQHYLAITGLTWGRFIIFNADSWEMITVDVSVFTEKEQAAYITALETFWNEHIIPQVPPTSESVPRIELPEVSGTIRERNDPAFQQVVDAYTRAQEDEKGAKALVEAAKTALLDVINKENGVYESDDWRVYYTPVEGRVTFDRKSLAAVKPLDRQLIQDAWLQGYTTAEMVAMAKKGDFDIDLSQFEKRGNDFSTLRVYPKKR